MSVRATGSPARKLAVGLPPTATTRRPNVVRRATNMTSRTSAAATATMIGTPRISPVPSDRKPSFSICLSWPSASTSASPRPATKSASVATIGCTPT
jgi:hypothetical protein